MPDKFPAETRSRIMSSIRSRSKLENRVTRALWHKGFRFRKNVKSLPGSPDIAIKKYKIVIFIDSCFWHGCADHFRVPATNTGFWVSKISQNKRRDEAVTDHYVTAEWHILRIWEHDFKDNFEASVARIAEFMEQHSRTLTPCPKEPGEGGRGRKAPTPDGNDVPGRD